MNILSLTKNSFLCVKNYGSDIVRYMKYSQIGKTTLADKQLCAKILATSHVIEKGLSLRTPRLGFGKDRITSLLILLKEYESRKLPDNSFYYINAVSVLNAYINFHDENEFTLDIDVSELKDTFNKFTEIGGVKTFSKEEYIRLSTGNVETSISSRYSLRQFSETPINEEIITRALEIAQKTPSVCNRQSWETYWAKSTHAMRTVRRLQSGNRGFGDEVDSFLIVTTDLSCFFGIEERNQSFIDGGLYAMNLMMALHSQGIGTCPLNWSTKVSIDRKLRVELKIPHHMNIIAVIAIGNLPDTFTVAKSARKPVSEVLKVV